MSIRTLLKTTTALAVSAAIAMPIPALGQAGEADPGSERAEQQRRIEQQMNAQDQDANLSKEERKAKRQAERKEERQAERKEERQAERKEERQAERKEERRAERQAERAEAQAAEAAAAAAAAQGEAAQVTEQSVTDGDVRNPDQDFETRADAEAAPRDDNGGISDLGKIAILGLGALAVGKLLSNGDRVVANSGDRVVVEGQDGLRVIKNDDELLRQPGSDIRTETFADGATRTTVTRADGSRVVTLRTAEGRVLRRVSVLPDGREVLLFDDTRDFAAVDQTFLDRSYAGGVGGIAGGNSVAHDDMARALAATGQDLPERSFSLAQIRQIDAVRHLVPEIEVEAINFDTGSAAIRRNEANALAGLGAAMRQAIAQNPADIFLIEGHTDAVGAAAYNLTLSDRRAETVALALTRYFEVPPENLVVQGYGESDLKVWTDAAERANRRVAVRRITPLLN